MLNNYNQQVFLRTYYLFYRLTVDGIRGPGHIQAIKDFQKKVGITVDGIWGNDTEVQSLAIARVIQRAVGAQVDGIIGSETIQKIKDFQKKERIAVDGIVGSETYSRFVTNAKNSHFSKTEFKCGCGGQYCNGYNSVEPSSKLVSILETIRSEVGDKPVVITSGIRCPRYNYNVGGISGSAHILGKAADIYIAGVTDTSSGRERVVKIAYKYGATYSYHGTPGMGSAVHINV